MKGKRLENHAFYVHSSREFGCAKGGEAHGGQIHAFLSIIPCSLRCRKCKTQQHKN